VITKPGEPNASGLGIPATPIIVAVSDTDMDSLTLTRSASRRGLVTNCPTRLIVFQKTVPITLLITPVAISRREKENFGFAGAGDRNLHASHQPNLPSRLRTVLPAAPQLGHTICLGFRKFIVSSQNTRSQSGMEE
jgi:hypothetical protein